MRKEFSQSDFQKLRWLEGTWRGSDGGKGAFYEGYRFIDDTIIGEVSVLGSPQG